jgi:hypothetical protein
LECSTTNQKKEMTMRTATDYTKLAATLDYASLEKKLEQLTQRDPPRTRKTVADVLEPLRERLLDLHSKGWSSGQLADELKTAGVPASAARLRECLSRWMAGGNGTAKSRTRRKPKHASANTRATIRGSHVGRSNDNQTGQALTAR